MNFYRDEVLTGKAVIERVFKTDRVLAYHHTKPFYPIHIVVIPKALVDSLVTIQDDELLLQLMHVVQRVAQDVLETHGAARVITNLGEYQDFKHLHFHIVYGAALKSP